jgi:hypothetical protein
MEFREIRELGATFHGSSFFSFFSRCAELFFERIAPEQIVDIPPGFLKEFSKETLDLELSAQKIQERKDLFELLNPEPWICGYQQARPVFSEEDFRELRMVRKIGSDSLREGLRKSWKSRSWLESRLLSKLKKEVREMPSLGVEDAELAGSYPMGGVCGIGTRGDLSTILPSELFYSTITDPVDLFQVKYLENDLLYYERDEQQKDEFERRIILVLLRNDLYPDPESVDGFSIHPFFLFGILSFWISHVPALLPSLHFIIEVRIEISSRREKEFLQVLKALLEASQSMGRVNVNELSQDPKPGKDFHNRIIIGQDREGESCLHWNRTHLRVSTRESQVELELGEIGLTNWVKQGFCLIGGKRI